MLIRYVIEFFSNCSMNEEKMFRFRIFFQIVSVVDFNYVDHAVHCKVQ